MELGEVMDGIEDLIRNAIRNAGTFIPNEYAYEPSGEAEGQGGTFMGPCAYVLMV